MIVVGILGASGRPDSGDAVVEIARHAAATGARTEVVGAAPVGPAGDRLLLQLATASVGHATVTRSSAPGPGAAAPGDATRPADARQSAIEPADLDLALRYLPDIRVVVLVAPAAPLLATGVAAASFAGATLVVVGPVDADSLTVLGLPGPSGPIVLDPPARDPDGAFAGLVAALGVRLDAGADPSAAWRATVASLAVDRV